MDVFLRPLAAPFASRSAAGLEINNLKNFCEKQLTQRNTKEAHTSHRALKSPPGQAEHSSSVHPSHAQSRPVTVPQQGRFRDTGC